MDCKFSSHFYINLILNFGQECPLVTMDQSQFLSKSAKTFFTPVFQCCLWFAKNRDCDEILPYHGKNTDKLGFESSKIILATDLTHQSKQSLIFAFGEGTAEVAIGYFPQMARGMTKMPRVRKNKTEMIFSPIGCSINDN